MSHGGTDLPASNIITEIESIFKILRDYNIPIHESNRFLQFYRDYLLLIETDNLAKHFPELLEGMRDFFEIKSIVSSSEILRNSDNELKLILGGNRLPSEDTNSTARNLQYQLYLASRFSNSGMNVKCVEPDFSFEYDGSTYSVAAKRITSRKKILKRLKEAEQQILQYEHEGFIALSLDRLLQAEDPYIVTNNPDLVTNAAYELLIGLVKELFPAEFFESRNKRVKGLILTFGIPSFTPIDLSDMDLVFNYSH
ncbi:hypothetical protein AB6A23_12515 [Paenibacillus tarimensis]